MYNAPLQAQAASGPTTQTFVRLHSSGPRARAWSRARRSWLRRASVADSAACACSSATSPASRSAASTCARCRAQHAHTGMRCPHHTPAPLRQAGGLAHTVQYTHQATQARRRCDTCASSERLSRQSGAAPARRARRRRAGRRPARQPQRSLRAAPRPPPPLCAQCAVSGTAARRTCLRQQLAVLTCHHPSQCMLHAVYGPLGCDAAQQQPSRAAISG